jgi:hypothetical protein
MLPDDFFDEPERCWRGGNLVFQDCLREDEKCPARANGPASASLGENQKKPSFLGL